MLADLEYPFSSNRLLIIDWASVSYHTLFAMNSRKKNAMIMIDTPEAEWNVWRHSMLTKIITYIKKFNPIDVVFTTEGSKNWRVGFVKEWYETNYYVHYDDARFWLNFDNLLYSYEKMPNGNITVEKHDLSKVSDLPSKKRLIKDLPKHIKDILWLNGLPAYKGTRKNNDWPFLMEPGEWKQGKEDFAKEIAPIFRAWCPSVPDAEGDDIGYGAVKFLGDQYDDIVIITRDSDWKQLKKFPNITLYNHVDDQLTVCDNPEFYINVKVLAGDKGDNINGIALPGKKTKLGEAGAIKLYESPDWTERMMTEGWENQYIRNKKLIDFDYIPTSVLDQIKDELHVDRQLDSSEGDIMSLQLNAKMKGELQQLHYAGIFSMLKRDVVMEGREMIAERAKNYEKMIKSGQKKDTPPRQFGNFDDVFKLW